jgi:sialidase-1
VSVLARRVLVLGLAAAMSVAMPGALSAQVHDPASTSPEFPGTVTDWNGFRRHDFEVDGCACRVIIPAVRAPANPWVWRARFPDFHADVDRKLLAEGFHIAYMNTDGQLGSPRALAHWDRFYAFLRERGLAEKVALEGVSRGGLFVYRWAAQNPERVACIYADTPVCDVRSWPLGRGAGIGDAGTWQHLLTEYSFTHEQALAWNGNPIDLAAPIVAARIPLLHLISENDQVVPPRENTYVLRDRVRALGGELEVLSVPEGTAESHGHHFAVPAKFVDRATQFLLRHTATTPGGAVFHHLREGLARSQVRLKAPGKHRIVFLGGSITHNSGWRELLAADLQRRFPMGEIEFVNAGIPSMGSTPSAFRIERDVFANGPVDLLFVEAAVNDSTNGRSDLEQCRAMEGIVRHALRRDPGMDVVLLHFVDPEKMAAIRGGAVPAVIANHERVAEHYGLPSLDLAREVTARIDAREFSWEKDFKDLHPSPFGQLLYYRGIRRLLDAAWLDADTTAAPAVRTLPTAMDIACYERGRLVDPGTATVDRGFHRVDRWRPTDGAGTRPGFVDVPMLVAEQPGAQLTLRFRGNAVGLFVAAGPDAGAIEWSVDGGEFARQDLFTRWSGGLHLPWAYVLAAGLPSAEHVLVVRVAQPLASAKGRSAVRIAHFLVDERE